MKPSLVLMFLTFIAGGCPRADIQEPMFPIIQNIAYGRSPASYIPRARFLYQTFFCGASHSVMSVMYQASSSSDIAHFILESLVNIMAAPVEEMQQLVVDDAVPKQDKPKKEKKPKADKPKKEKPQAGTFNAL
jgi:hypothetical protein